MTSNSRAKRARVDPMAVDGGGLGPSSGGGGGTQETLLCDIPWDKIVGHDEPQQAITLVKGTTSESNPKDRKWKYTMLTSSYKAHWGRRIVTVLMESPDLTDDQLRVNFKGFACAYPVDFAERIKAYRELAKLYLKAGL